MIFIFPFNNIIIIISVTTTTSNQQQLFATEIVIFHEFVANVPYTSIHNNHLIAPHIHTLIHACMLLEKLSSLKNNTKSNCFSLTHSRSCSAFSWLFVFFPCHRSLYTFWFCVFRVYSSVLFSGKVNIMDMWIVYYECGLYAALPYYCYYCIRYCTHSHTHIRTLCWWTLTEPCVCVQSKYQL